MKFWSKQINWFPLEEEFLKEEDVLKQEQFEKEVEEAAEQLEHPYMVALEYCGWLPEKTKKEHELKKKVQSCNPYCCFNHQVGLPRKKYRDKNTNEELETVPLELYGYEWQIIHNYETHTYYGLNKVRGAGASEILAVRHMAYKYAVTNRIKGRQYLLAAGIKQSIAVGMFRRIVDLLKPHSKIVYDVMPNINNPKDLRFRGGGEAHALPASPNAARGEANVGDVLLDESGFWDLIEDELVLMAFEPFASKSGAHIGVFSTPNGQRGFFWTKIFDPELAVTKYFLHVITLEEVKNVPVPIIDIEEAEKLKKTDPDLYAQEFGNAFLLPSSSIFGDKFQKSDELEAEF